MFAKDLIPCLWEEIYIYDLCWYTPKIVSKHFLTFIVLDGVILKMKKKERNRENLFETICSKMSGQESDIQGPCLVQVILVSNIQDSFGIFTGGYLPSLLQQRLLGVSFSFSLMNSITLFFSVQNK